MKKILFLLVASLLTVTSVGCSGGSKEAGGQAAANTLEKIKQRGNLTMAMGGKYPPFNYKNKQNELDGFDMDIAKEIAKRLGVEAKAVTTEWDGIIAGLLTSKYDIILGSMAITEERKQKVDFVHYYTSGASIVAPSDSPAKGPEDLKGVTVGVGMGTTYEKKAREFGADVKTYATSVDAFTDMVNGRVQAVITDKLIASNNIKEKNLPFKLVGEPLYEEKCGIAIRKDDPELKAAIEKALEDMRQDGTYTTISEKWFGMDIR
ncbi:MAG: ABC transporter substrate-binding protein [Clostridia bacterium]